MFAHPRCPCTRASLSELEKLAAASPGESIRVVLFRPESAGRDWTETDIALQAQSIRGVEILWDEGGRLAARFGAKTSGHVLIYDERGSLVFSGGITSLRGHAGSNSNSEAAAAQFSGAGTGFLEAPVFGCPLVKSSESCQEAGCNPGP
jgi:hypothetical protein